MIQLDYLKSLIKIFEESDLSELRLKDETSEIELKAGITVNCATDNTFTGGMVCSPSAANAVNTVSGRNASNVPNPFTAGMDLNTSSAGIFEKSAEELFGEEQLGEKPAEDKADFPINDEKMEIVKSPIVGTFYEAPGVGQQPFVTVGEHVNAGDTLCIIESMKMMNELAAPCSGVIRKIYVENETFVTAGKELFAIETEG